MIDRITAFPVTETLLKSDLELFVENQSLVRVQRRVYQLQDSLKELRRRWDAAEIADVEFLNALHDDLVVAIAAPEYVRPSREGRPWSKPWWNRRS